MTEEGKAQEWYSNKDLYEMMVELSKGLESTNKELAETRILIRDYNGLRATINECKERLDKGEGGQDNSRWTWAKFGYLTGLAGIIIAILTLLTKAR